MSEKQLSVVEKDNFFFFQAEDGIRDPLVTGVQTCALPILQVLGRTETGDSSGTAWTETGELDHRGHDVGIRLVDYVDEEVGRIVGRIRELLDAGWQRVDVVTDHGWILLPGGMEKVDLPPATAERSEEHTSELQSR